MIGQAFVLGAGLGLRLRPLTDELPKPLVPIFQKPLITFALDHLISAGVEKFIVNTHRLPETFERAFAQGTYRDRSLRLVHEPVLLETGGGIKNAEPWLGTDPFLTYSGDILTDADLGPLIEEHLRSENEVTLGLRKTGLGAQITLRAGKVTDISSDGTSADKFDFAGIAVWNPSIFSLIPAEQKTSFFPPIKRWLGEKSRVGGMVMADGKWFNIGSVKQYLEVHRIIFETGWKPSFVKDQEWPAKNANGVQNGVGSQVLGACSIGANCRLGDGARIENSVLWPGAQIASESHLINCVVRDGRSASGVLNNTVV